MRFDFGFYSSLLLITFSQGIVYSFLLLKKGVKTQNYTNYWLSAFIFLCSLFVAPWMLGFAGWYDNQPYRDILFYVPFQHLFFIGPLIYFYTQSLLNPSFKLTKKNFFHLIPGIIYLVYTIWMWIYDKFIVQDYFYYKNGSDKDFDFWYQASGFLSMIVYFILSIRYYSIYKKLIFQISSNADQLKFEWIRNYLYAFLSMITLRVVYDIASNFFPFLDTYKGAWWFYLTYSIILYYIAITGYSNAVNSKIPFSVSVLDVKPIALLQSNEEIIIEEADYEIETTQSDILEWKNKIISLLEVNPLYNNPELTLNEIARHLQTNISVVSKAINKGFGLNFNDFINNYRVEAIKECFKNGEHKKSTILGIAFDCGFNSKATFNRAFKKNTGLSPKEFINSHKL